MGVKYGPDHHPESETLQYGMTRLVVVPHTQGGRNQLILEVAPVKTKTKEASGRGYVLRENLDDQALCWNGPMLFLWLGLLDSAFETIDCSNFEQIFEPGFLGPRDDFEVVIKPGCLKTAICRGLESSTAQVSSTYPMSASYYSEVLVLVATNLGYERGFSSHKLRHFGCQALINAGVPLHVIQYQMHHAIGSRTHEYYFNSMSDIDIMRMAMEELEEGDDTITERPANISRIRYDPRTPLALTIKGREAVLQDERLQEAFNASREWRLSVERSYNKVTLAPEHIKAKSKRLYKASTRIYNIFSREQAPRSNSPSCGCR